ncbi:OPT/YSL family transporter [Alicyclobacillus dauci]|uniref:OPT/YSL family transporter n=1 Tax=Alicyclobacillus dauci TaxID=1475485 RepID=A0ABY6Z4J0_9BACL|nr:OPT/YSL family transporter [Alicyclobacillus dauci]WAH37106.1 OPT/YSL family transporter [Alicyclobacillus dauci]
MSDKDQRESENSSHPRLFEPSSFIFNLIVGFLGAIIGIQLIVTLGITPNTAIIGALIAMLIARIPGAAFQKFKSVHRQNLVQTTISGATFGAANALLLPIGIPFLLGKPGLVVPVLIGVAFALVIDATILYKIFDTRIFPAANAWPPGVATGEAILAGDKGGRRGRLLLYGTGIGLIGSYFGISMSAFGVAFIGNIWALAMWGIGLLVKGYDKQLFGVSIDTYYIPHGIMVGAGLVALVQVIWILMKKRPATQSSAASESAATISTEVASPSEFQHGPTRSDRDISKAVMFGFLAYLLCAIFLAVATGLWAHMSVGAMIGWIVFAAFVALAHELIVGLSAMHAGWFPAFAVALISLVVGMLLHFPAVPLAVLVSFAAATGPAFADMGYDFKSGWILRSGHSRAYELGGRRQQYWASIVGFAAAFIIVAAFHQNYFAHGLIPPVDKVYVATIKAGLSDPHISTNLLLWAIPGAIVQLIGGPSRQIGILFATGLLINNPLAGWAVLVGLAIRIVALKIYGKQAESTMSILAAGFIAGDALYGFFHSIFQFFGAKKG